MYFQNKPKAFGEVHRVLREGGKFIFSAWDAINYNPRAILVKNAMEKLFDDFPAELINSVHSFSNKKEIGLLLEQVGFNKIKIIPVQKYAHYNSADDIINGVTTGSLSSIFLNSKSTNQQEQFKQALKEDIINSYGAENIK